MPRKRRDVRQQEEAERRLHEAADKPINPSGVGEDPAIKALLEKFATASPAEALDIISAVQRHIQGQADIDNPEKRDKILVLKAKASEIHDAETAWSENKEKFIQEIFDKNPPATGKEAEKIKARAARIYQKAMNSANAKMNERKLRLDYQLANGPKEEILVTGHFENVNGQMLLLPDEVRIMHRGFLLKPGKQVVPSVVAGAYRNILAMRAERDARRNAMSASDGAGPEFNEFFRRQRNIDAEFGKSDFTGGLA